MVTAPCNAAHICLDIMILQVQHIFVCESCSVNGFQVTVKQKRHRGILTTE